MKNLLLYTCYSLLYFIFIFHPDRPRRHFFVVLLHTNLIILVLYRHTSAIFSADVILLFLGGGGDQRSCYNGIKCYFIHSLLYKFTNK